MGNLLHQIISAHLRSWWAVNRQRKSHLTEIKTDLLYKISKYFIKILERPHFQRPHNFLCNHFCWAYESYTAKSYKAVAAYFSSKQLLSFGFAELYNVMRHR